MEYLILIACSVVCFICGMRTGKGMERNRQAKIRQRVLPIQQKYQATKGSAERV